MAYAVQYRRLYIAFVMRFSMRFLQWYKNLLVFLPLLFLGQLFSWSSFFPALLGFFALCLVSSSYYLLNDIVDLPKDRLHPEKSKRLLASGKISVAQAFLLAILLLFFGLWLSLSLSVPFFALALSLFLLTLLYTFFLKNIAFADVLLIALNFVLRAVAGVYILPTAFPLSPWLVLCTFFLALFLAVGKRVSEMRQYATAYRSVLAYYTPEITRALLTISTTALIIVYTLYSFFSQYPLLLFTLPLALYTILYFLYLVFSDSTIPQHLEYLYREPRLFIGVLLWIVAVFFVIYL